MRIATLNINGLRSGIRKGFYDWLAQENFDIVCLQEVKIDEQTLQNPLFSPTPYFCYHHAAQKKGYSGCSLFSLKEPKAVRTQSGVELLDHEGRFLQADFEAFSVVSVYFPSGTSGETRQAQKYYFLDQFIQYLKKILNQKKPFILCGDWNIAHKPIDLKNWKSNQKNSGFLPEERAWMDKVLQEMGFLDAFRLVNAEPNQYTWWSHRGKAWDKNVGWRIDYHVISPELASAVRSAHIYRDQRFSDHAPLVLDYAIPFLL